jgi:hypothetical protein
MVTVHSVRRPRIVDSYSERTHEFRWIPEPVVAALRDVEAAGWREMYDRETVLMLASSRGHREAAEWLSARRHLYFVALRRSRDSG